MLIGKKESSSSPTSKRKPQKLFQCKSYVSTSVFCCYFTSFPLQVCLVNALKPLYPPDSILVDKSSRERARVCVAVAGSKKGRRQKISVSHCVLCLMYGIRVRMNISKVSILMNINSFLPESRALFQTTEQLEF